MRRLAVLAVAFSLVSCDTPDAPLPTALDEVPEASYGDLPSVLVVAGDHAVLPTLAAPTGATRVSVLLRLVDPDGDAPALATRAPDGRWIPLEVTWREGAQLVAVADLDALTHEAELRLPSDAGDSIAQLTWAAVVPMPEAEPEELDDVAAARQPLRAELAAMGVVAREDWGARGTGCSSLNTTKTMIAIHHTVSNGMGDPAANVRGIQNFHMDGRGWCDVGYHFLVALNGQVFEARPIQYLGAHVGGHNTNNIGVSFMGCFHPGSDCASLPPQVPPDGMVEGGAAIVAGLADLYGISINGSTVKGHRDHSGASTACPGDHLHARLSDLRNGTATGVDRYGATYVAQTFPLASQPFDLAPNETRTGYLDLRNTGTLAWAPGATFLGTTGPRDVASPLRGPDWIAAHRPATVDAATAPGETGRFAFTVRAPLTPGEYPQYLGVVQEGVAWFSDSGHAGPPDDQLQIRVTVLDVPPVMDDAGPAGPSDAGPVASPDGGEIPPVDAGPPVPGSDAGFTGDAGESDGLGGGCGCRVAPSTPAPLALFAPLLALVLRRRR